MEHSLKFEPDPVDPDQAGCSLDANGTAVLLSTGMRWGKGDNFLSIPPILRVCLRVLNKNVSEYLSESFFIYLF